MGPHEELSLQDSLSDSLEKLELEQEQSFRDDDDLDDADEHDEHDGLFPSDTPGAIAGLHSGREQSESCCAQYVPRSRIGRAIVFVSVALNAYLVGSILSAPDAVNPLRSTSLLPCAVLLSTFPNSGTSWTQSVFRSSTGLVSEAVYGHEGPPTPYPGIYVHGTLNNGGPNSARLQDPSRGECLFVKSHGRVNYNDLGPSGKYQRAVVLYRDREDNLDANLRYLTKIKSRAKDELRELCGLEEFVDWKDVDPKAYDMFVRLHSAAHKRFYCHAEQYPIPKLMVTYAQLLSDPYRTFGDIMVFSGYPTANITKAMEDNAPRSHTVHGSLQYVPVGGEECQGVADRLRELLKKASPCLRRAARILQF